MPEKEQPRRIFLSFNSQDLKLAKVVRDGLLRLEPNDIFFHPLSITAGFWLPKLAEKIADTDAFILLIGPGGIGPWQTVEYYAAFQRYVEDKQRDKRFPLVPATVLASELPGLPFLSTLDRVEAPVGVDDEVLHRLLAALKGGGVAAATPLWKLVNPYRGLVAMAEENADYFYGRESETQAALNVLAAKPNRIPILIGASGVGKSSVAQAGVLSALKSMRWPDAQRTANSPWPDALRDSRAWAFITMRPGDAPLQELAAAFIELWQLDLTDPTQASRVDEWTEGLRTGRNKLTQLIDATQNRLKQREGEAPARLLLYLDQGEELYTRAAPHDAKRFTELLAEGVADHRVSVLGSLRADFFHRLQADTALFGCYEHIDVAPLGPDKLLEVVTAPARALGVGFEDDKLAGRLTSTAAGEPGALPLLSYLLTDMWTGMVKRDEAVLRLLSDAIALGGVLADRAEAFLASNPAEEEALRRLLTLRLAVIPAEGEPVRRQALRDECTAEEWALAARLADQPWRLVVMRKRASDDRVIAEVAHEALLRAWPRLAEWLDDESEFLVFKGEVEQAERRWLQKECADAALLTGFDLASGENWLSERGRDFSGDVAAFIQRSIAHSRAELVRVLENESRLLGALSAIAAKEGLFVDSIKLALAGWPRSSTDPRPRVPDILDALSFALSSLLPVLGEYAHDRKVTGAQLNRDESRIVSWSDDKTVRLWDVATGRQIGPAMTHDDEVRGAQLNRDESCILSWSSDKTVRLWDVATGRQIGPAMTHDGRVWGAQLSRDESRILSWSLDNTVRLWDMATGRQIGPAMTHDGPVWDAELNRDESRILSRSSGKTVRLWDVATGRQIGPAMTHDDEVRGAQLNRDESRILSWSEDKTVRLWDVATGRQIGPAMTHDGPVRRAQLNSDESCILSWSDDKTVRLWDVATGRQIGPAMTHDGEVKGAQLNGDESRILSWSLDNTVRLWDVATGRQIGPAMTHDGEVEGAQLNRDESRILSWSEDKTMRLWDVATGRQIGPAMTHDNMVWGARLNRDESRILSWSFDHTVRLWDVATGRQIGRAMTHDDGVGGAQLNRDESRILSRSSDHTMRLWDVATGRQIGGAMTHDGEVWGALLNRDESRVLSWSDDKTVRLWDVATGREIGPAMTHDGGVGGAQLNRDESRILSWSSDKTVRLWDVATGRQIGSGMTHDGGVGGAQLNRDESCILSWSSDKTVRLWDVATGRQLGPAMTHDGEVWGALLNRDESRILSWSFDHTVRLWDVATGRQIGLAMTHDDEVRGAQLNRDESRILSWSFDHTVRLWDVATGRQLGPAMTHDGEVWGVQLNRDESRILSWSFDHTVRLWDVATGRQLGPAMTHDEIVVGARLNRDESRILSWSFDKTVRLWDVATGRQIGPAMTHDGPVRGAQLNRDESRILSWSDDKTVRLWDASWRGRNLLEVACNYSPPDHDLSAVSARYGIKIADPICQSDRAIPVP